MCHVCAGIFVRASWTEFQPGKFVPEKEQVVYHVKHRVDILKTCHDLAEIDGGLIHIA
jgi:hypothetical protein